MRGALLVAGLAALAGGALVLSRVRTSGRAKRTRKKQRPKSGDGAGTQQPPACSKTQHHGQSSLIDTRPPARVRSSSWLSLLWGSRKRKPVDGPAAYLIGDYDLTGGDKWLGGELGTDGRIYGVPGSAKSVLVVSVDTHDVCEIGHHLKGPYVESTYPKNQFKWLRGARGRDGSIYGVPSNANTVLRIQPATGKCDIIGGPWPGHWKWHGGVMGPDGNIYGIPCNAEQVLKIDTVTGECSLFGGPYPGRLKWYGGLLGCDGCIYGIPNCAQHVLKIDPKTQSTHLLGQLPGDEFKWHGGAVGADGCIYGFPSHADRVLKIDPRTGFCGQIGPVIEVDEAKGRGGRYKYGGGVPATDG